jgi:transcriptional regulator with XRE-family HTH domain
VGKKFADYAAERAQQASAQEAAAVGVFDAAYAKVSVGAALATARKARHLNQVELAGRTGMSQGDLSKIERGVVAPTTLTLLKIVHALGAELTLTIPSEPGDEASSETAVELEVAASAPVRTESLSLVMA